MLISRLYQIVIATGLIASLCCPGFVSATVISVETSGEYKVDEVKDFRQRETDTSQELAPANELETPSNLSPGFEPFMARIISTPDAGLTVSQKEIFSTDPKTLAIKKKTYGEIIEEAAQNNPKLDIALIKAVIEAESNYDSNAVSPKGAMGLMQLMPATAKRLGVINPFDPSQNIQAGARELNSLMENNANISLALAAYNAGQGAVTKYKGIPPYKETQNYVVNILTKMYHHRQKALDEDRPQSSSENLEIENKPRPMKVYTYNW